MKRDACDVSRASAPAGNHRVPCPFCHSTRTGELWSKSFHHQRWALSRCSGCGLHFTSPAPSLADLDHFYGGEYHRALCSPGASERIFGPKFERYRSWIRDFLATGRSLDMGCSTGLLPHMLQQAGFEAEGVELNPVCAEWGSRHYGVTIRNSPIESGEYTPETYDLVTLTDVLEHTIHPLTTLNSVRDIVKAGGYIFVTFPDIRSLESRYYYALARLTGRDWLWSTCHIPLHTWEFTPATAQMMFAEAGLRVVGYRRFQPFLCQKDAWLLTLLSLPPALLSLPLLRNLLGTQMEFMLQKPATPPWTTAPAAQPALARRKEAGIMNPVQ